MSPNNASQQCWASQQCQNKHSQKSQQLRLCERTHTHTHTRTHTHKLSISCPIGGDDFLRDATNPKISPPTPVMIDRFAPL